MEGKLESAILGALEVSAFPRLDYSGGSPRRAAYRCTRAPQSDRTDRAECSFRVLMS